MNVFQPINCKIKLYFILINKDVVLLWIATDFSCIIIILVMSWFTSAKIKKKNTEKKNQRQWGNDC